MGQDRLVSPAMQHKFYYTRIVALCGRHGAFSSKISGYSRKYIVQCTGKTSISFADIVWYLENKTSCNNEAKIFQKQMEIYGNIRKHLEKFVNIWK
jgi:hypothetical protein